MRPVLPPGAGLGGAAEPPVEFFDALNTPLELDRTVWAVSKIAGWTYP